MDSNCVTTHRSAEIVVGICEQCPPTESELEMLCRALKAEIDEIMLCVLHVQLPVFLSPTNDFGSVSTKFEE